jgi:hypothetical protein
MDFSIFEKFKANLIALLVGVIVSVPAVWTVADNLHKKEVAIFELQNTLVQKRLFEVETLLKAARQEARDSVTARLEGRRSRKPELESLIRNLDVEIKTKKMELGLHSGLTVDSPKDASYLEVENELHTLQAQRDDARRQLSHVVGG